MCIDTDLFGDVIVTLSDVEKYLMSLPNFDYGTPTKKLEQYIKNYGVTSAIKSAKLNGGFYDLEIPDRVGKISSFNAVYVKCDQADEKLACPDFFHVCDNFNCTTYQRRAAHAKSHAQYLKRKKARLKR